jgi:hypothetical protein
MPDVAWPYTDDSLKNFILVGTGEAGLPQRKYWVTFTEADCAKFTAMAWLIAGFATRAVDLKVDSAGEAVDAPAVFCRFEAIQDVAAEFPGMAWKHSKRMSPPEIPWPITRDEFRSWLWGFSQARATWPAVRPPVLNAQSIEEPAPTVGVIHIQDHGTGGAYCGCKGHDEPNHPVDEPLVQGNNYCSKCVQLLEDFVQVCNRGRCKMVMFWDTENPGEPLPEHLQPRKVWAD